MKRRQALDAIEGKGDGSTNRRRFMIGLASLGVVGLAGCGGGGDTDSPTETDTAMSGTTATTVVTDTTTSVDTTAVIDTTTSAATTTVTDTTTSAATTTVTDTTTSAATTAAMDTETPSDGVTVLKEGTLSGTTADYQVTGTVQLARDADGYLLQFRDYAHDWGALEAFCYLTPAPDPDSQTEIEDGRVVMEMTESLSTTGTFSERLSEDLDPTSMNGVGFWNPDFKIVLGTATLSDV